MSTSEMDGVRSFAASTSVVEELPQLVEGNMQDTLESVLRNSVIEPRVGMEFDSLLKVTEFIRIMFIRNEFATMIRNSRKNKGFTETSYINLKYNREGTYSTSVDDASKKRSTIKNSCEAGIKVSMDSTDRKLRILGFIENHNHDLSLSKSRHFAAFQHISTNIRKKLLINDNAGVRVNNSIKSSIVEAGGYENVTYNQKDVRNFLDKERRLKCRKGDEQALHDYFVRMQVFVEQFENAMRNKVENEILSNFECFKGKLECSSSSPMEKQFQETYTHEIFKRVRIEFSERQDYIIKEVVRGGEKVKYKIQDEAATWRLFEVRFSSSECLLLSQRKKSVKAASDVVKNEVVRSPMIVKCKDRPRTKRLKSSMEEAVSKPKKKRNTAAARNLAQSISTTGVGGSAYGDGSTSNMEYPMSMSHSNDGVIDLTNPMPSQSFVLESMSQSQAHRYKDKPSNLT
uniref:Protein FAR1-RELATED SEQUENCE n=1 Tax=Fagus sylvatica TaxID=28930 RepID=A0A2N9H0E5_FAGSY